jgi:DNA-binding XRE family transcriptional regulator
MVSKLADDIFELRVKHFDRIFRALFFYQPGMLIVIASCFQKKTQRTPNVQIRRAIKLRDLWLRYRNEYPKSQTQCDAILREVNLLSADRHSRIVRGRAAGSLTYRRVFLETQRQIDLAVLVREMREASELTQRELAERIGTAQSVIARLEDAEYSGHSLSLLKRIAAACNVNLTLHAEGPGLKLDVPLAAAG